MTKENLQKLAYQLMMLILQSDTYSNQDTRDVVDALLAEADFMNHKIKVE